MRPKEILITSIDKTVGPILDCVGSREVDERWNQNVCTSTLVDRKTGEPVGSSLFIVHDGMFYRPYFDKQTTLRQETIGRLREFLGEKP